MGPVGQAHPAEQTCQKTLGDVGGWATTAHCHEIVGLTEGRGLEAHPELVYCSPGPLADLAAPMGASGVDDIGGGSIHIELLSYLCSDPRLSSRLDHIFYRHLVRSAVKELSVKSPIKYPLQNNKCRLEHQNRPVGLST